MNFTKEQRDEILNSSLGKSLKRKLVPEAFVKKPTKYEDYLKTYAGGRLLEKYPLATYGTWQVLGEDPNCDMSGSHHQPYLATYTGSLEQVIRRGVELPGFWQWGAGGDFKKIVTEVL